MKLYLAALLFGIAFAGDDDKRLKGVGPGYEKSYLDYAGKFKGGARKFLPIYQKEVSEEKEIVVKGGCGAKEEEKKEPREKRSCGEKCDDLRGVGPGYEKSFLDYAGKFKGGARKFLPIYQKEVSEEKEVVVKGGCGAKEEEKKEPREKRSCGEKCDHLRGVGPGYEKSYLDYAGKFKGGARKFLPIYQKEVSEEKEVVVKGGCGAKEEEKKEPREKRCSGGKSCDLRGVGPGYEKSYLDYDGHFKGGARKFLPIYQKEVSEEKEVVVKGGCGAKEEEKKEPREKRSCGEKCDHLRGVGPGYEKSYLDYAGKFKGGARKFLPIYQKEVSEEKEVVVKGGCGAKEEEKKEPREKRCSGGKSCDLRGVGPGYEKSYLDYDGHFKGGARKFLPIYQKEVSEEKEVVVKGGCGAKEEEKKEPREKRSCGEKCDHLRGVGPGYEKSYLDYAGKFKGGARKFLPIYQKEVSEEKEVVVKGGCGAKEEEKKEPREKRCSGGKSCDLRGVGPGYEKSYLDYDGHFKGGARKFLPIYQKEVSEEKEVVVKGGCGAKEEEKKEPREKRCSGGKSCDLRGVGPGYEKSYLDYDGHFKGGARKFLPIYQKEVSEEKEVVVKGGCGAKEEEKKEPREKRCSGGKSCDLRGVGPGYEKSYLDYDGHFKGGARKFLPIYQKQISEEKEIVVKGGAKEEKKEPREKRTCGGKGCDLRGVGPGYEKSYLDYAGKFKGGARKFLPIYQKEVSEENEVVVKGGCGAKEEEKKEPREKRCSGGKSCDLRGVGPGYEKSYLDYDGHFKGGARKFLPIYQKQVSEEKEIVVKGGAKEEKKEPREKRSSGDKGDDLRGVGPGYEKSYLDYAGKFKGGARKFLPIYKKQSSAAKEVVIKGGAAPCPKCGKVH